MVDPVEEEREEEVVDNTPEDARLGGIFNEALGNVDDDEDEEKEEEKEEKKDKVEEVDNKDVTAFREELAAVRERQAELEAENNIYKMQLQQKNNPNAQVDPDEETEIDFDELNKEIAENPAKAFIKLFNEQGAKIAKIAERRAVSVSSQADELRGNFRQDRDQAISEFADYWEKDKEFTKLAHDFYDKLTSRAPVVAPDGTRYTNGAIYASMAMAYAKLNKEGKLGNSKVVPLREKKRAPGDNDLGEPRGDGKNRDEDELFQGVSSREVDAMKRTAKRMGIPWDKYKSNLKKMKQREPGFGGLK